MKQGSLNSFLSGKTLQGKALPQSKPKKKEKENFIAQPQQPQASPALAPRRKTEFEFNWPLLAQLSKKEFSVYIDQLCHHLDRDQIEKAQDYTCRLMDPFYFTYDMSYTVGVTDAQGKRIRNGNDVGDAEVSIKIVRGEYNCTGFKEDDIEAMTLYDDAIKLGQCSNYQAQCLCIILLLSVVSKIGVFQAMVMSPSPGNLPAVHNMVKRRKLGQMEDFKRFFEQIQKLRGNMTKFFINS